MITSITQVSLLSDSRVSKDIVLLFLSLISWTMIFKQKVDLKIQSKWVAPFESLTLGTENCVAQI